MTFDLLTGRAARSRGIRRALLPLTVCALLLLPAISLAAGDQFDGNWQTKLTCPPKGDTDGYTWQFPSVIKDSNLRGEHGTAGQPGYLLIEGKIAADGTVKVTSSGIVYSRQYARGVFAAKGESYSYSVKVQFKGDQGSGTRDQGLGIVGRPCTFDFAKHSAAAPPPANPPATTPPAATTPSGS
jgi:hypothetical protein